MAPGHADALSSPSTRSSSPEPRAPPASFSAAAQQQQPQPQQQQQQQQQQQPMLNSALRRVWGVFEARSCDGHQARLHACLQAAEAAAGSGSGRPQHADGAQSLMSAVAAGRCAEYAAALQWCEQQVLPLSHPHAATHQGFCV